MFQAVAQRVALGAVALSVLAGCGGGGEAAAGTPTGAPVQTEAAPVVVSAPAAPASTEPAPASTPGDDDAGLRDAVQGYSDAFLTAQPTTAYDYFSARCQEQVSLSYFTGILIAAKQAYGTALPIKSFEAEIAGDMARVTYTYDDAELNQAAEPWTRESGAWKQDDC